MDFKKILFRTSTIDVEKALPDAVIFCNKDGKIQWVNDKAVEVFETSKIHLLTSNIADFIENTQNLLMEAIKSEEQVIVKIISKEAYFLMTAQEIEEGYVMAFRNTVNSSSSTLTSLNTESKTSNCDKNSFILKLSNDFKAPLQSIVGFSQAMADGLGGTLSEQQDKYIRIINKNSSELMYFMTKLLELIKTETDEISPDYKTFDIINTINSIARFNEQLYKDKELKWNINIAENIKNTFVSDEEMLKVILQNILEVILKSVDMGDISISLSIPEEEIINSQNLLGTNFVQISISSNSLLLSESDLEYMFDPYKIVDTSNKKNILRAMTLGCVKNLVQILNGNVWVESKILKKTSFNVILPQIKNQD